MNWPGSNSDWMPLIERVGIALVHSLWQGALVGLVLLVGLVALRQARAQVRYLACCLALITTLALPVCTFLSLPSGGFSAPQDRVANRTAGNPTPPPLMASAAAALEAAAALLPEESSRETAERSTAERDTAERDTAEGSTANVGEAEDLKAPKTSIEGPTPARGGWLSAPAERLLLALVAVWSVGVIVLSCRFLGGYVMAWRLTRRLVSPLDGAWKVRLQRLARRMGIDRPIEIWQSAAVEVPAVIGCFRPVILLPIGLLTGLSVDHVESILAHELAHIRRHDFLVNAVQSLIETALFYHPCVWWISARIRAEREHCCDETAVAVCGDAIVYARALTGLEGLRPPARLAMALSGGGPLLGRIRRLVGRPTAGDVVGGWLAGSLAIILPLAVGSAWAWDRVAGGGGDGTDNQVKRPVREATTELKSVDTAARAVPGDNLPSEPTTAAIGQISSQAADSQAPPTGREVPLLDGPPKVAFLVPQQPGFGGPPKDLLSRMVEEHGPQRIVQVVVSGVPANASDHVYKHLWQLMPNLSYFGTSSGDTVNVHLAPIDDLDAFAAQIDLGEIRSIDPDERVISLVADRTRLPPPETPAVVDRFTGLDIETLCQRLVEMDRTAVEGLAAYGSEAEPAVAPLVKHEDRRVRRAALLVLKQIASDASTPVLLSALGDADLGNRDLAWQAICKVPGLTQRREVMEAAAEALTREPEQAAKWLTVIGPAAEPLVWPSLRDDDPSVRLAAAGVLAQIGTTRSLPALEPMSDDEKGVSRAVDQAREAVVRRSEAKTE